MSIETNQSNKYHNDWRWVDFTLLHNIFIQCISFLFAYSDMENNFIYNDRESQGNTLEEEYKNSATMMDKFLESATVIVV